MFAYCRNNPIRRVDRSGSVEKDCFDQVDDEIDVMPGEDDLGYSGNSFDPYQAAIDNRYVPNPYGRHGGPSHRGLVESLRMLFNELGFDVSTHEQRVYISGTDRYRYPDLTVDTGYERIYVQVGKSTSTGDPIAREQRAIDDLKQTGNQVWFFCYDD